MRLLIRRWAKARITELARSKDQARNITLEHFQFKKLFIKHSISKDTEIRKKILHKEDSKKKECSNNSTAF